MELFHVLIIPLMLIFISFLLQEAMVKNDFFQFYKMFFQGLLSGLLINFIIQNINKLYEARANFNAILFKSIIFDGLLFALLAIAALYFMIDYFNDMSLNLEWSSCTLFAFSFLCGIYTTKHLFQALSGTIPHSMSIYISLICFIFFLAMVIGFGLPKFLEAMELPGKILWAALTIIITTLALSGYSYVTFYQYNWHLLSIGAFTALFGVFFFVDFKDYLI